MTRFSALGSYSSGFGAYSLAQQQAAIAQRAALQNYIAQAQYIPRREYNLLLDIELGLWKPMEESSTTGL